MAEHSPKHGLTRSRDGWIKRINKRPTWIVSAKVAPTGADADAYYEQHFAELWKERPAGEPKPATPADPAQAPLADLCDAWLDGKRRKRDEGRLDPRSYHDYAQAVQLLCDAVGGTRQAGSLTPADFAKFDGVLAKRYSPISRRKRVRIARMMFRWAQRPPVRLPAPDFGDALAAPSPAEIRRAKKKGREDRGVPLLFTPAEVRAQLKAANPALRAMILLAINAGLGNADLAALPLSVLSLPKTGGGWLEYARGKTGAERLAWLWPETVKAIRDYQKVRPRPKPAAAHLLFVTRGGQAYVRNRLDKEGNWVERRDKIVERYRLLLKGLGQFKAGRSFYSLRRSHRTWADEVGDQRAAALCMGHLLGDMGSVYVIEVGRDRVKALCEHVRRRVLKS